MTISHDREPMGVDRPQLDITRCQYNSCSPPTCFLFLSGIKQNARMKTTLKKDYFPLASAGNGGLVTDKKIDQNIHEVDGSRR